MLGMLSGFQSDLRPTSWWPLPPLRTKNGSPLGKMKGAASWSAEWAWIRSTGEKLLAVPVSSTRQRTVTLSPAFQSTWRKALAPGHSAVSVPLGLLRPSADADGADAKTAPETATTKV